MKWIFEHLQLIVVIAGAIAYWINQRAKEKAGEEADYDGDGRPDTRQAAPVNRGGTTFDQDERVRRIREEIQRKIAERRGQAAPPPMPAPRLDPFRPVFQETAAPIPPPLRRTEVPPPLRPSEPDNAREVVVMVAEDPALERQRRLAEQLARLEEDRRAARERAAQARRETAAVSPASAGAAPAGRGLAAELRDPRALRRAFVMRELLSPPVALR